mgnify:CR=1 FL=1
MSSKVLIIYEYQILYELLNEIKENFSFELIKSDKKHFDSLQFEPSTNYLVLSSRKHEKIHRQLIIDNKPLKLEKLIEFININFLKNKFSDQSNIKIGKYNLDLNSRNITYKDKNLSLTERESDLIIFINDKKNVSIKDLQKKVWHYSQDLETHTVETHIYRLRKKMKEIFADENFIKNEKKGYSIN